MDTGKYLERIGYKGDMNPGLSLLQKLQESHLLNIPFENLDIHNGVAITLDIANIYDKIVRHQRGGFCYELNGLFYELLIHTGFKARRISARVFDKIKGYGPEYDHLAVIVETGGKEYLTDVGFGEFAFSPLRLDTGIIQYDARGDFILDAYEKDYLRVSRMENNIPVPQYIFRSIPREFSEFQQMCDYHQTSPLSHFTRNMMITKPTREGRITITNDKIKIKADGIIQESTLQNEQAFKSAVFRYFQIEIK